MYLYNLIDGVMINDSLEKSIYIKSLSDSDKDNVAEIVDFQFQHITSAENLNPVNERHLQSIHGLILLNEHASASISAIGDQKVNLTYSDVCSLKMTAQDWNIVLTASMAVDEHHNSCISKMLA